MPKVIYLTGAPASGKSSTTNLLAKQVPGLLVWEYGARLTEYCKTKTAKILDQAQVRAESAKLVTIEDVEAVDKALLSFVQQQRSDHHIVIDSHAVTKEHSGYRITPFSLAQFAALAPDEIWVLYASPQETRRRIEDQPAGRPLISEEEARMHTMLQASVAATYSMSIRCPAYLFDTALPRDELVELLAERLS